MTTPPPAPLGGDRVEDVTRAHLGGASEYELAGYQTTIKTYLLDPVVRPVDAEVGTAGVAAAGGPAPGPLLRVIELPTATLLAAFPGGLPGWCNCPI